MIDDENSLGNQLELSVFFIFQDNFVRCLECRRFWDLGGSNAFRTTTCEKESFYPKDIVIINNGFLKWTISSNLNADIVENADISSWIVCAEPTLTRVCEEIPSTKFPDSVGGGNLIVSHSKSNLHKLKKL